MTDLLTELDGFEELPIDRKIVIVRGAYTPRDVCEQFEIQITGDKIRSPFNEADNTPSCHLYEDHWYDFSTGRSGDVVDLVAHFTGKTIGQVLRLLSRGIQEMELDPDRVQRAEKKVFDMTGLYRDLSTEGPKAAGQIGRWAMRLPGVAPSHLLDLWNGDWLGVDAGGNLLIPHLHEGIVTGVKVRHLDGHKTSVTGSSFTPGLYNNGRAGFGTGLAVITEGESDMWALSSFLPHDDLYALPSGAGLWRADWLAQLESYETIYTAFDNDRAGQQATEKVRSSIGWGRWKELKVPSLFNDVREAIMKGWEPRL